MKYDYNQIPVHYCAKCLSLSIVNIKNSKSSPNSTFWSFCLKCGSTKIATANIIDWEILYENEYGETFLDNGK